ncbi:ATP-dependent DNA helicase RecQ-like [Mytilus galloprovincialis]|uniref:ATP-dependent DNA helicase RecQ-like n=1 Tax=Mytilus galloprovincialis TaxID=29158 RepID=UPI003F7BEE0A
MAILPTGFGKLLPYQMLVSVRRELEKETSSDDVGKVIVCSPLVALMADQVDRINAVPNVTAAYRSACSNGDDDILKGKFDYLFASPETLISDKKWRMTLQQMNVSLIVEDEFHTICTWGGVGEEEEETEFRKWFRHIEELRSMFTTANLLALSATCTTTMRKMVMRELHMHKDLTTIISNSPN